MKGNKPMHHSSNRNDDESPKFATTQQKRDK